MLLLKMVQESKMGSSVANSFAALLLISVLVTYPLFIKPVRSEWFEASQLDSEDWYPVMGIGEYLPDIKGIPLIDVPGYLGVLASQGIVFDATKCKVSEQASTEREEAFREFEIEAVAESEVTFPLNYSGLEKVVLIEENKKSRIAHFRTEEDPRIKVKLPPGKYKAKIVFPTLLRFFFDW